jgi:hypothetical protein
MRTTIPSEEARAVMMALLASGRVPPVQPTLLDLQRPGTQPLLQRFWATVYQHHETVYLILFLNNRCLVRLRVSHRPARQRPTMI